MSDSRISKLAECTHYATEFQFGDLYKGIISRETKKKDIYMSSYTHIYYIYTYLYTSSYTIWICVCICYLYLNLNLSIYLYIRYNKDQKIDRWVYWYTPDSLKGEGKKKKQQKKKTHTACIYVPARLSLLIPSYPHIFIQLSFFPTVKSCLLLFGLLVVSVRVRVRERVCVLSLHFLTWYSSS